jgi:hypothetical protein
MYTIFVKTLLFFQGLYVPKFRKEFFYVAAGIICLTLLSSVAFASGDVTTALTPVGTFFCSVARFMRTYLAYAIIFGAFIAGGLLRAGGSQLGVRFMQGSVTAALLVLIAPAFITALVAAGNCAIT